MNVAWLLATWFGCGLAPRGPGTAGSIAGLAIAWPLATFAGWHAPWFALLTVLGAPAGIWAAGVTARQLNLKDPRSVVVDEVLGQWLTLAGALRWNWRSWLLAFVLFRLFDIWKPPPVRQLEALPGGTGIIADDLMAGIYGALVLSVAGWFNFY